MALATHSVFFFGHIINDNNNLIPFKEGAGPEKIAEVPVGAYTLTKFLEVVTAALNAASSLDWTYSVDRTTRIVSLFCSGPASILFASGSAALNAPASLMGFNAVDILSATSFVGTFGSGQEYRPQFPLQDYKGKNQNKKLINAVVTRSATGDTVSVQSFGVERSIKFNLRYITNKPSGGTLRSDPAGVENAITFLDYIVEKNPVEFMSDESALDTFDKIYLTASGQDASGASYELIEYLDQGLPEYYESGLLTFKVINIE